MSVLDNGKLVFERLDNQYATMGCDYEVYVENPGAKIHLGTVLRKERSTDSKIAGTRLRRLGKGATEWVASPPKSDWVTKRGSFSPMKEIVGSFGFWDAQPRVIGSGGMWLAHRGSTWDTRKEAVYALAAWYDFPEKRETVED